MASASRYKTDRGTLWRACYTDEHGDKVYVRGFQGKTEALCFGQEKEAQVRRIKAGLEVVITPRLFKDVYEAYKATIIHHRSFEAINGRFENHLLPAFGDRSFHEIPKGDFTDFLRAKEKRNNETGEEVGQLAPQTVRHLRVHLVRLYNWALDKGWVRENPAASSAKVKVPKRRPKALRLDQIEQVAEAATTQLGKDLIRAAAYLGARRAELTALKWSNVDLEARTVFFERSGTNSTTKGGETRYVPIPRTLLPHLARRKAERKNDFVFTAEDGRQLREDHDCTSLMRTALRRADIASGYRYACAKRKAIAPSHGEANGRAKLTRVQVKEIRKHLKSGFTLTAIGKQYGVSRDVIAKIRDGKLWAEPTFKAGSGCGWEFTSPERRPMVCPQCGANVWPKPIPANFTFKSLRTTYITQVVKATGSVRTAQELAGHQSHKTTEAHYIQGEEIEALKAAIDQVPFGSNQAAT